MADVLDILDVSRNEGNDKKPIKKKSKPLDPSSGSSSSHHKKPNLKGLNREVYALLCSDNKDNTSLIPTDFAISSKFGYPSFGYKKVKADLSLRKIIKWSWVPFTNPARKDGFQLYHWRVEDDKNHEYPFAHLNVVLDIPSYTDAEYQELLRNEDWTKQETDYLFTLCRKYDLRFVVIQDRWDTSLYKDRSVECIKDRYYTVCDILSRRRNEPGNKQIGYVFDAEHERKRKEQLKKLYNRTHEEVEEEKQLREELRKIEQRKKEREKKTQVVQKMMTAANSTAELRRQDQHNQSRNANVLSSRSSRKKNPAQLKGSRIGEVGSSSFSTPNIESVGIKFPESKTSGVWIRSSRMKLPSSVGQKRSKAIDQLLKELKIDLHPIPTEEVCRIFNELRIELVLLYELKIALNNLEFELQTLQHQIEAGGSHQDKSPITATPLSATSLPDSFGSTINTINTSEVMFPTTSGTSIASSMIKEESSSPKKISELIDVTSSSPLRKRKAAIEQCNFMRKLRKN